MSFKASVIIPAYNAEKYLKEAIDSIINQTFQDFEVLVINDNSTDNTVNILQSYTDKRIQILNSQGSGISDALNLGLDSAKGEYIIRMDADDISLPERFEKQIKYLDENPDIAICGSIAQYFNDNSDLLYNIWQTPSEDKLIKTFLLTTVPLIHPSVIIRKSVLDKYELRYSTIYNGAEDFGLWTKAAKFVKFHNIEEVLLYYRRHNDNATFRNINQGRKAFQEIIRNNYKDKFDVDIPESLTDVLWHCNEHLRAYSHEELLKICEIFNALLQKVIQSNEYENAIFHRIISNKWDYLQKVNVSGQNPLEVK